MRNYLITFLLFLLISTPAFSLEALTTINTFSKSALLGMQLSVRHAYEQGKVPSKIAECIQALDDSSFNGVIAFLVSENLNQNEQLATEKFFISSTGKKYGKYGLLQVYTAVGISPPEALPTFTDEEYKELEDFSHTSAV